MRYWDTDVSQLLPALGANPDTVTASGFSAGSYMSNMIHVAFSETIKGIGMVSGGPYMQGLPMIGS